MIHAHHKYVLLEAVQDMYGDIMNSCFLTMAWLPSFPVTPGLYVRTQRHSNKRQRHSKSACHPNAGEGVDVRAWTPLLRDSYAGNQVDANAWLPACCSPASSTSCVLSCLVTSWTHARGFNTARPLCCEYGQLFKFHISKRQLAAHLQTAPPLRLLSAWHALRTCH